MGQQISSKLISFDKFRQLLKLASRDKTKLNDDGFNPVWPRQLIRALVDATQEGSQIDSSKLDRFIDIYLANYTRMAKRFLIQQTMSNSQNTTKSIEFRVLHIFL